MPSHRTHAGSGAVTGQQSRVLRRLHRLQRPSSPPHPIESRAIVPESWELIASYHTHDALDPAEPDANFELPSSDDLISDSEEGVDGYLSTPGGRFWFIDTVDELVILLGDTGYFEPDQLFAEDIDCPLLAEYSFEDIFVMEDEELAACEL